MRLFTVCASVKLTDVCMVPSSRLPFSFYKVTFFTVPSEWKALPNAGDEVTGFLLIKNNIYMILLFFFYQCIDSPLVCGGAGN